MCARASEPSVGAPLAEGRLQGSPIAQPAAGLSFFRELSYFSVSSSVLLALPRSCEGCREAQGSHLLLLALLVSAMVVRRPEGEGQREAVHGGADGKGHVK